MTDLLTRMDGAVERLNLLNHPFYQAWSAGTLPVSALADYARDWGAFVRVVDRGWESVGQADYAQEEREHAIAWDKFAAALGTAATDSPRIAALAQLRQTAERLFSTRAGAFGALYAFEAQQPATSQSKLRGLLEHYTLDSSAEHYFALHENDYSEAQWLRERLDTLSDSEREAAAAACEELCQALWDGLSGVYSDCAMA
jgi:pyrroloquinoline-quinone synthase